MFGPDYQPVAQRCMSSHCKNAKFACTYLLPTLPPPTPWWLHVGSFFLENHALWHSSTSEAASAHESVHHAAAYDPTFSLRAKCSQQQRKTADVHVRCCLAQKPLCVSVRVGICCCVVCGMCVCVYYHGSWADASLNTSQGAAPSSIIFFKMSLLPLCFFIPDPIHWKCHSLGPQPVFLLLLIILIFAHKSILSKFRPGKVNKRQRAWEGFVWAPKSEAQRAIRPPARLKTTWTRGEVHSCLATL